MAVNLLELANQLRGSLHSNPSGPRTRSSNDNERGNPPSGSHIPGTDIKQGAGVRSVARKGRRGDSELRRVGGEVAHVNTIEANAIDALGPLGEAWVQSIGSGTTNPKTGLPEYSWLSKALSSGYDWAKKRVTPAAHTTVGKAMNWTLGEGSYAKSLFDDDSTWKPSEGKWGIFGSTHASRERDKAKKASAARHSLFEDFRRDYENQNIAGIFTEDEDDNTDLTKTFSGSTGFNTMLQDNSGLVQGSNDIADYTDEYDERKETELADSLERDLKAINIHSAGIESKRNDIGTGLSSGLFGMLTQSQEADSQKGFAGSGNFAADFKKKQAIKEAESQFGGADREQEGLQLEKEGAIADAMSDTQDLHDEYNQEFWNNMMSWDTAINS